MRITNSSGIFIRPMDCSILFASIMFNHFELYAPGKNSNVRKDIYGCVQCVFSRSFLLKRITRIDMFSLGLSALHSNAGGKRPKVFIC